jgi:hypothetical protein
VLLDLPTCHEQAFRLAACFVAVFLNSKPCNTAIASFADSARYRGCFPAEVAGHFENAGVGLFA